MKYCTAMMNRYETHGCMTKVWSTGKNSDLHFYIDTQMLWKIKFFTWRIYINSRGYKMVETGLINNGKKINFTLARYLLDFPNGKYVDHIDRDPTNNRLSNLRVASPLENSQNANKHSTKTTSIYKGVCFHKSKKLWFAYINSNKKRYNIGYFKNENDAAIAYNNKIKELNLAFSNLNEIV